MNTDNIVPTWVSHSSISDFIKCPKAYYLHNMYHDPMTGNKIALVNPPLTLGQSVHEALESLLKVHAQDRAAVPLLEKYEEVWQKISGKRGGFKSQDEEQSFKERGRVMIQRVMNNPGPIINKALKISSPDTLPPRFCLSIDENILLCGKVDWLEYLPETDSVHIIDFKTGKHDEEPGSLQLGIYCLLVQNLLKRKVQKVSYWYLDRYSQPIEMEVPDCEVAKERIMEIALKIKAARRSRNLDCPRKGCFACKPYTAVINGECEYVGSTEYQDLYVL